MSSTRSQSPVYFSGKPKFPNPRPHEDFIGTEQGFLAWIGTIWVNQNEVPTEPEALKEFELKTLIPEYKAYFDGGGKFPRRSCSLEEYWLSTQLYIRHPMTCLLNVAQPVQEVGRITRLRKLSAEEIWAELQCVYSDPAIRRPFASTNVGVYPFATAVYDGNEIAHFIMAWTIHDEDLHFSDPWPGRSLLAAEHNSAGVAARESDLLQKGWQITRAEFEHVVFAVFATEVSDRG